MNHIDCFTSKAGEPIVIVDTDEVFDNIEYKNDNDEKVRGNVNRFFASPVELKRFFSDPNVIKDVNENGNKIHVSGIEKIPFSKEEIEKKPTLKGKTHYVFKKATSKQVAL